jgi:uncharacterized protein (TIGR02246 family)
MTRRSAPSSAIAPALALLALAGCSSRPVETGLSTTRERPLAATPSRSTGSSRPIPEVIARAKRFRMPSAAETTRRAGQPHASPASAPTIVRTGAIAGGATASAGATRATPLQATVPLQAAVPLAALPPAAVRPGLLDRACGPDEEGIRETMRSYLQAFNRHDPAALAAHWSDVGENVDLDSGETTSGREAVRDVFAALFEEDAGASIDIELTSIRPVANDVAVVDGVSRISFTDAPASSSRFAAVMVRRDGGWVIDTVRESAAGRESVASRPLDELAWLVGQWEDAGEGVTASTQCFWSANRAFLVRSHIVSADAVQEQRPLPGDARIPGLLPAGPAGKREITEIVGWDPDRGQIRSWYFTSAGRFAEGTWSRDGETWTVRLEGPAFGDAADATCTLSRMGDDELSVRCGGQTVAEFLPPACDFLRTARSAGPPSP